MQMMEGHSYSEICKTEEQEEREQQIFQAGWGGTVGNLEGKTEPQTLPAGFKARIWLLRTIDSFSLCAVESSQALESDTPGSDPGSITYWLYDLE